MKVSFFAWEASWGRILTMDQLKRRGSRLLCRCYLYKEEEELVYHILLHCSKVVMLFWQLIYALFRVQWNILFSIKDALLIWHDFFVGKNMRKVWRATLLCLFSIIQKKRNRRAFKSIKNTNQAIKQSFMWIFWEWVRVRIGEGSLSLMDFIDLLHSN